MSDVVRAGPPVMPGYGVSEGAVKPRPWSWAEEVLRDGHNYWLATGRPDGRPHVMPVWGVWVGGGFWFSTGAESRKAKNLAGLAECAIGTERGTSAVIVEGRAERVAPGEAPAEIARTYVTKYGEGWPDGSLLLRVAPRVAFGFSEAGDFAETATRWTFAAA